METLLPQIAVRVQQADLEPAALFDNAQEIWLEVGFGGGEHLAEQAAQNPNVGIIGAEPFINGVAKLLIEIEERNLNNIRILHGDVRPFLMRLPSGCITRLFVLYPDPWPKKRHHKRRIINPWFLDEAARVLKPGGELRVASDIADYQRWTLMHICSRPEFFWTAEAAPDWRKRPSDWPRTRYEAKADVAGRVSAYLRFTRTDLT